MDPRFRRGAQATATLLKHEFLFGCNIFSYGYQEEGEAQYRQRFEKAFNYATLNFIWKYYEPKPGQSEQRKWQETKRTDWHSTTRGEQTQAAQVYETYRLLFSHPSVEAISWWDLSDRRLRRFRYGKRANASRNVQKRKGGRG